MSDWKSSAPPGERSVSSDTSSARGVIGRQRVACVVGACVLSLLVGVSCAMEKPPVELRLDSPPKPESIPLSEEERETLRKHPHLGELVQAWSGRGFSVDYEGEAISFQAERAYTTIQEGLVVSVDLYSPNLTADELHRLMMSAFRFWEAPPAKVRKFEEWWQGSRERIVEMRIGEGIRSVTLGVCPSFNQEKPHIFKCIVFWGFPRDRAEGDPASLE